MCKELCIQSSTIPSTPPTILREGFVWQAIQSQR